VKDKKWESVEHYHQAASSASEDYGVNGVPHVVLIDTHGNIAFVGHPSSRKLEEDIETLLKGEKLAGIQGGADADEEEDATFKELDLAKVDKEIALFSSKASELTSNADIKSHAAHLQRAMVVVVKIVKYQPATGKFLTQYQDINLLIGPQSSIDILKPLIEKFINSLGASFEVVDRIRAI
jgi:hypothetical protein